jgi:hypothetical protein
VVTDHQVTENQNKMNIPQPGDYIAKTNGQIIIGEASTGALMADVPYVITQGDDAGFTGRALICIAKRDGTIQTATVNNLKAAFGWDGVDPFWLADNEFPETEFALNQCIHEEHNGKTYFKVGWLNPLGGGMKRIESADRRSVLSKYGSKFRALAGATPAAPKPSAAAPAAKPLPKPAPPAPVKKPTPPPQTGPTATMEECWEELCKANEGKSQDELSELWFATIKAEFNTDNNSEVTAHQWGALKAKLADNLTM